MNKIRALIPIILIVMLTSFNWKSETHIQEVQWLTFEEAISLNKERPKKLLINLYTDWCGWCKVMETKTYTNTEIATYINNNFYPVKFNAQQMEDVVFNGHTFKYVSSGNRGYHELAASLMQNKLSFPTTVFLDEKLRLIQPIAGFLSTEKMKPILEYIGDNHYKDIRWDEFTEKK